MSQCIIIPADPRGLEQAAMRRLQEYQKRKLDRVSVELHEDSVNLERVSSGFQLTTHRVVVLNGNKLGVRRVR